MALAWNAPKIVAAIRARADEAAERVAARVLETARAECPVKTGALRESGRVTPGPSDGEADVYFGDDAVNYALPVHEGTARIDANPFLLRAVILETDYALETFEAIVRA